MKCYYEINYDVIFLWSHSNISFIIIYDVWVTSLILTFLTLNWNIHVWFKMCVYMCDRACVRMCAYVCSRVCLLSSNSAQFTIHNSKSASIRLARQHVLNCREHSFQSRKHIIIGFETVIRSLLCDTDQPREMLSSDQSLRDLRSLRLWSELSISLSWSVSHNSDLNAVSNP